MNAELDRLPEMLARLGLKAMREGSTASQPTDNLVARLRRPCLRRAEHSICCA